MMLTTLTVLTLSGLLGTNLAVQPAWQSDYRTALKMAAEQHKPLAVFIGKGKPADLKLTDETAKVLKANYVVLAVNTADAKGLALAQTFEMTEGVVVSDRTGERQALRIVGTTAPADLPQTLARLADPARVPVTTEVQGPAAVAPAPAPSFGSQYVPTYLPAAPVCRT
jgi:hypothetical protein